MCPEQQWAAEGRRDRQGDRGGGGRGEKPREGQGRGTGRQPRTDNGEENTHKRKRKTNKQTKNRGEDKRKKRRRRKGKQLAVTNGIARSIEEVTNCVCHALKNAAVTSTRGWGTKENPGGGGRKGGKEGGRKGNCAHSHFFFLIQSNGRKGIPVERGIPTTVCMREWIRG
jgi:hypothetical protein